MDALISAETEIWFRIVYINLLKTGVALLINYQFIRFDSLSYGKLSEWFKELVLKTSDGRESTVSSNLTLAATKRFSVSPTNKSRPRQCGEIGKRSGFKIRR